MIYDLLCRVTGSWWQSAALWVKHAWGQRSGCRVSISSDCWQVIAGHISQWQRHYCRQCVHLCWYFLVAWGGGLESLVAWLPVCKLYKFDYCSARREALDVYWCGAGLYVMCNSAQKLQLLYSWLILSKQSMKLANSTWFHITKMLHKQCEWYRIYKIIS